MLGGVPGGVLGGVPERVAVVLPEVEQGPRVEAALLPML